MEKTFRETLSKVQKAVHHIYLGAAAYNAPSITKTVELATREMDNRECFWGFTPQMTTLATEAGIAL